MYTKQEILRFDQKHAFAHFSKTMPAVSNGCRQTSELDTSSSICQVYPVSGSLYPTEEAPTSPFSVLLLLT